GVAGNTEGKTGSPVPVTTQGLSPLDGATRLHNTPALIFADGSRILHIWICRWRRLLLCFIPAKPTTSFWLGGSTELFGEPERRQSLLADHDSETMEMRAHPT